MWAFAFVAVAFFGLMSFVIGLVVGSDITRARLISRLTQQLREDGLETFRRIH